MLATPQEENKGHYFNPWIGGVAPGITWIYNNSAPGQSDGEFTVERMAQYIQGFEERTPRASLSGLPIGGNKDTLGGVWYCPEVNSQEPSMPGWFWPFFNQACWMHFAYFGNVTSWKNPTPTPRQKLDLVDRDLSADKVLMTDLLAYFVGNGPPNGTNWAFHHGKNGSGSHAITGWADVPDGNANAPGSIQDMAGIHVLWGDGHVTWKTDSDLQVQKLLTNPAGQPNVDSSGSGYMTFY